MPLDDSELVVYQQALALVELVDQVVAGSPTEPDDSTSWMTPRPLSSQTLPKECPLGLVDDPAYERLDAIMVSIVSMLVALTRA